VGNVALLVFALAFVQALPASQDASSRTSIAVTKRRLLLFTPSVGDVPFKTQMEWLRSSRPDLRERDLEVVLVVGGGGGDERPVNFKDDLFVLLDRPAEREQRRRFHVAPGQFTVLLIGKDGGEKLRRGTPISIGTLDALIDAMPMRQQEMNRQR
jgi:hypothetical protein